MATTVVSWNIAKRSEPWRELVSMGADVALVQEANLDQVPPEVAARVDTGPVEHWDSRVWNSRWWEGRFKNLFDRWAMVVRLSDRVEVEWFKQISPMGVMAQDEIAVSGIGTIAAARVKPKDGSAPFIAVSMYARWVSPHPDVHSNWIYQDGSAHRIISDLSAFVGSNDPSTHRILAAGDLNMIYGANSRQSVGAAGPRPHCHRQNDGARHGVPGTPAPRRQKGGAQRLRACRPTPATFPPTTPAASRRRRPRTSSTTRSPRAASTTASRCGP